MRGCGQAEFTFNAEYTSWLPFHHQQGIVSAADKDCLITAIPIIALVMDGRRLLVDQI